jgi:hypothetical protein
MTSEFYFEGVPRVFTAVGLIFILFILFIALVITILITWAYCKIFSRAGYCWALGLLTLVPIANIVVPFILAFGDWPVLRERPQPPQQ